MPATSFPEICLPATAVMNAVEFNLSDPLERLRAIVLLLPAGPARAVEDSSSSDDNLERAIRGLYEAAHGRMVETQIGPIQIAPAISPFLTAARFSVRTRAEFLALAGMKATSDQTHPEPDPAQDVEFKQPYEHNHYSPSDTERVSFQPRLGVA